MLLLNEGASGRLENSRIRNGRNRGGTGFNGGGAFCGAMAAKDYMVGSFVMYCRFFTGEGDTGSPCKRFQALEIAEFEGGGRLS